MELAIIIPAYKPDFLRKTLESLATQTSKEFNVYIGDDASPYDLQNIIRDFDSKINIRYTRFNNNLGSVSLTAQWTRCIELSEDEPWIWLFSDDDMMDPTCVQTFLETDKNGFDIFHFNIQIIDENDIIKKSSTFPAVLSSRNYTKMRFGSNMLSFAVEYVVRRSSFEKSEGFIPFDLAWHSDDATWISLSQTNGIKTIPGPFIKWRNSGINITSIKNIEITRRKLNASLAFFQWLKSKMPIPFSALFWFINSIFSSRTVLSSEERKDYLSRFSKLKGGVVSIVVGKIYYHLKSLKRHESIHLSDI